MKILYLPAYFYPEQAASAYLSDNRNQAFADAGFDMVVYTPVPTRGISIEERKKYKHRKADSMYGGRMIVYRFSLMREGGGPIVRALRYSLSCIRQFYWGCFAQEARQCDVMFISSTRLRTKSLISSGSLHDVTATLPRQTAANVQIDSIYFFIVV